MIKLKIAAILCSASAVLGIAQGEDATAPKPTPPPVAPTPDVVKTPSPEVKPNPVPPVAPVAPVAPAADPVKPAPVGAAVPPPPVGPAPMAEPKPAPEPVPVKVTPAKDMSAAKKLLEDLESPEAPKSEAAVKAMLKGLDETSATNKFTYLIKVAKDINGDAADARAVAMKKVVDVIKEFHNNPNAADALTQIVSTITSPDPNDDPEGKTRLASALNETFKAGEINPVIEDLASTDPAVVEKATKRLQEYGAEAADLLSNAVGDERLPVKKGAADILKAMGPKAKDAASGLAFLLDNEDKVTRHLAAGVLENLGPEAADVTDDLVMYLSNEDRTVRRTAANLLKKIGVMGLKEKASDLVDLLTDADKNTRAMATELLIFLGPSAVEGTESLGGILEDTQANDADSRKRAARVLGAIGPEAKGALEILKKRQDDTDVQIKDAIVEAIRRINGEVPNPAAQKNDKEEDDAPTLVAPAPQPAPAQVPPAPPAPNAPAPAPTPEVKKPDAPVQPPAPQPDVKAPAPAPQPVAPKAPEATK